MITCSKCKLQNPDIAKFCQGCGDRLIGITSSPIIHQRIDEPSIDAEAILIKTIVCPHCKKDTLPDFDACVNCGKLLTQSPNQPFIFQSPPKKKIEVDIPPEEKKEKGEVKKEAAVDIIESKPKLDQQWEVITCPACGKKTRKNLGYCLNCKAELAGQPQSVLPKKTELKSKPIPVPKPEAVILPPEPQSTPKQAVPSSIAINKTVPIPGEVVSKPKSASPPPSRLKIIIPVILVLFILFIIVLSGVLLIKAGRKSSYLAKSSSTSDLQPAIPKSDTTAIYMVFNTVRDAMLSKDTESLMSCYSTQFPDYQAKLDDTEELIKTYDIVSLTYTINSSALKIAGMHAELPIKWNVKLRKYDDGSTLSATDSNYVVLAKEDDQWKIKQVLQR
jgi:hypothetical protein